MCKGGEVFGGSCGCRIYGGLGGNDVSPQQGSGKKLSSYQKFVKKEFKVCKKKYPSKTAPEIMKMIAKKWRESKK
jgi:hypothetical protein